MVSAHVALNTSPLNILTTLTLTLREQKELLREASDQFHTPQCLTDFILNFFKNKNLTTEINKPFKGCYVPLEFLGKDERIKSIMIEINRELYMNEDTGEKNESFDEIKDVISNLISQIIAEFFQ